MFYIHIDCILSGGTFNVPFYPSPSYLSLVEAKGEMF